MSWLFFDSIAYISCSILYTYKRMTLLIGKISTSLSFILDKVLTANNKSKRNQSKIKGIKLYSSKQSMISSGCIALATLWYKIEDHQDHGIMDLHFFIYDEGNHSEVLSNSDVMCAVIDKITHWVNIIRSGNSETLLYLLMKQCCM